MSFNNDTSQAQQKALDDALVAPADRFEFEKCNMRLKTDIKLKEATLHVVLDALALTPFYQAFLITVEIFPKVPGQRFKKPPLEHDIISFLRDLGHSGYIHYITDKADSDTSPKKKTAPASKGSRLKSSAKVAKTDKKKQPVTMPKTKGLAVLSEVALNEVEQIKLVTKIRKKDFHMSHASGSGVGDRPEVLDVPKYNSESEEEYWPFSQDDEDADNSEETESDNNGDDLTHPNLSTYKAVDEEEEEEEKADDKEVSYDQRVSTPPEYELTEEENKKGDDEDMEGEQEQDEEDGLYKDVHINLERNLVSKFINPSSDTAISSISGIVDNYLASKMKEVVDLAVQLQINKLKEEAQAKNQEFLNQIEKYVTEYLEAEVLVRLTNQPQTSYAIAASLSEFKLKKILIDKMEEIKSINISDIQMNLYNALVESYNSNKDIITSYGDVVTLKRGRDDQDKDEDPFAGSNRGSKRMRSGKETESLKEPTHKESKSTSSSKGTSRSQPKSSGKSAYAEVHGQKVNDLEEHSHQEFNTRDDDHKTKTVDKRPPQQWISQLAQATGTQSSFNEFLATPIDFFAFIMNSLKIDKLTQEVLTGLTYDLIKGTCNGVVELEYHLEEVFKATNDRLDLHNPKGKPYPHDLNKPLVGFKSL
nr:hypothetical protein [Tanacetum cinerariifolium]